MKNLESRLEAQKDRIITTLPEQGLDLKALFPEEKKIIGEFGIGKGGFLKALASRHPEMNFLGVDKYAEVLVQSAEKMQEATNIRLALLDLNHLLEALRPNSLDGLYLNFSDPWPKNRHAKRRLTHRRFLQMYDVVLKEGSSICFKTDSVSLFQFTLNELFATGRKAWDVTLDLHEDKAYENNIPTEYEIKFGHKKIMGVKWESRKDQG